MNASQERRGGWWLALPATAAPAIERHPDLPVIARHPSGHPWLLGDGLTILAASAGPVSIAAVGTPLVDELEFASAARRAAEHDDYDPLMSYPGNYGLVVCEPARTMVYSDVSGLHRAYTSRYGPTALASSHARLLANVRGTDLDPVWVAARLCSPAIPTVVRDTRSPYKEVTPIPAGCRAALHEHRAPSIARYWEPPEPTLSREQGADRLRAALEIAVGERARRTNGTVTVQLSGGLDSSALAALATSTVGRERVVLATIPSVESGDVHWSRLVAEHLDVQHEVLTNAPSLFSGLPGITPKATDDPPPSTTGAARTVHMARAITRVESTLHLNGQGGDEVLGASLAYLDPELRTCSRGTIRYLRGHAALRGWSATTLARHALAPTSYRTWLRHAAESLSHQVDALRDAVSWEAHPRLVPWASAHAHVMVRDALTNAAETMTPIGDRPLHATLARIRASAYAANAYGQSMNEFGATPVFPFFDREVIEACLSTRPWARTDPWEFKPLLTTAMRDVLPMQLIARMTKGSYTPDVHAGWSRHRTEVLALVRDPLLADLGFVDRDRLHRSLTGWGASGVPPAYVTDLLALELWARNTHVPFRKETA